MTKPDITIVDISPSDLPARTLAGVIWSPVYRVSGYTTWMQSTPATSPAASARSNLRYGTSKITHVGPTDEGRSVR